MAMIQCWIIGPTCYRRRAVTRRNTRGAISFCATRMCRMVDWFATASCSSIFIPSLCASRRFLTNRNKRSCESATDAIYRRSRGGIAPSGWCCEQLPYLVEFDNYGRSRHPGEAGQGRFWVWGWDEITWFSQQPENARNDWLRYAWKWVREHDPDGYVEMPGMRVISGAADGKRWYDVNQPSAATPNGFGQEQTIRAFWAADEIPKR